MSYYTSSTSPSYEWIVSLTITTSDVGLQPYVTENGFAFFLEDIDITLNSKIKEI